MIPFLSISRCNRENQLTLCLETASSASTVGISRGACVFVVGESSLGSVDQAYSLFTCQCYCTEFVCMGALGAV